jgi:hypothetical protein
LIINNAVILVTVLSTQWKPWNSWRIIYLSFFFSKKNLLYCFEVFLNILLKKNNEFFVMRHDFIFLRHIFYINIIQRTFKSIHVERETTVIYEYNYTLMNCASYMFFLMQRQSFIIYTIRLNVSVIFCCLSYDINGDVFL